MSDVLIIGSGFAGLWAALGAARRVSELGLPDGAVAITVLSRAPYHDIRVRNYEADLSDCRIALADLLDPVGVTHVVGAATAIDTTAHTVTAETESCTSTFSYDRLVLATGSAVVLPPVPGLREFGFDVDTFEGATKLGAHLDRLNADPTIPGADTVVVVGAGLTGIETACELPTRLRAASPRVLLVDHNPAIGSDMGSDARPVIEAALADNGVEAHTGVQVTAIDDHTVTLSSGEVITAATVVWCAGMRASSLAGQLPVARDRLGRVPVDDYLRVQGVDDVFAAGDVATAQMDDDHRSVMSCQHSRPMGRYAGHNVISDLRNEPMMALRIPWYVTVLDLGPAGAVYTEGWDRRVVTTGATAKATKMTINRDRIYPPRSRDRNDLLAAAATELQAPPSYGDNTD